VHVHVRQVQHLLLEAGRHNVRALEHGLHWLRNLELAHSDAPLDAGSRCLVEGFPAFKPR
jgi:hypothetical protein